MGRLSKLSQRPVIGPVARNVMSYMVNREAIKIAEHFSSYIRPMIAITEEERRESFNIRHQVYCEELGFEPLRENKLEVDEFDGYALHCLMQHVSSGESMGTVRVVTPSEEDHLLPMEAHCAGFIEHKELHPSMFRRDEICEISRLAVPQAYRRRRADRHRGAATGAINIDNYNELEMRCIPFIAIGLYLGAASIAAGREIYNAYAMMEPRLARSMRFVGIKFTQIGEARDYHGLRAPYHISFETLNKSLKPGLSRLHQRIVAQIEDQLLEYDVEI